MKRWAPLIVLCLMGCAQTPRTVSVSVPIPVLCTEPVPERPSMPMDTLAPGVDLFTFTKTAQAEIEVREGYEGKLRTALLSCRGDTHVTGHPL